MNKTTVEKHNILSQLRIFCTVERNILQNTKLAFYVAGETGFGILVSETEDVYTIQFCEETFKLNCKNDDVLSGKRLRDCKYGYCSYMVFLTEDGKVYTIGENDNGQLGITTTEYQVSPVLVDQSLLGADVSEIACGPEYSLALTYKGELFCWGKLEFAFKSCLPIRTPCFHDDMDCVSSSCINGNKVVQVTSGMGFVLALSAAGHVYSWGRNDKGQLAQGHTDRNNYGSPIRVIGLEDITKVVCGRNHCLVLSKNGKLAAWGDNEFGQLGTGDKITLSSPKWVAEDINNIQDITSSCFFNLSAVLSEETVYMWGEVCSQWILLSPTKTNYQSFTQLFIAHDIYPVSLKVEKDSEKENYEVFGDSWKQVFNDKTTSDLTIKVEDHEIYVHRTVLAIRSEYFRQYFAKDCGDANIVELSIDQFKYSTYFTFLYYLYTGLVNVSTDEVIDLMELANFYSEVGLLGRCAKLLKQQVNTENVVLICIIAAKYKLTELQEFCVKYAGVFLRDISQTQAFRSLDVDTLQKIIVSAQQYGPLK